jgi:hypothetical protein
VESIIVNNIKVNPDNKTFNNPSCHSHPITLRDSFCQVKLWILSQASSAIKFWRHKISWGMEWICERQEYPIRVWRLQSSKLWLKKWRNCWCSQLIVLQRQNWRCQRNRKMRRPSLQSRVLPLQNWWLPRPWNRLLQLLSCILLHPTILLL